MIMDNQSKVASNVIGTSYPHDIMGIKYVYPDHLGSSNVQCDGSGSLINREEYYPFGETSFGSYGKKRYRYCGKERDEESGMYYYGMRYYMPWTCRFTSVDPLAEKYVFQSSFVHADDNPIMKQDINGEGTIGNDKGSRKGAKGSIDSTGKYAIHEGDNLSGIASRYGTTVDNLKATNHINGKDDRIYAGKKLIIPGKQNQKKDKDPFANMDHLNPVKGALYVKTKSDSQNKQKSAKNDTSTKKNPGIIAYQESNANCHKQVTSMGYSNSPGLNLTLPGWARDGGGGGYFEYTTGNGFGKGPGMGRNGSAIESINLNIILHVAAATKDASDVAEITTLTPKALALFFQLYKGSVAGVNFLQHRDDFIEDTNNPANTKTQPLVITPIGKPVFIGKDEYRTYYRQNETGGGIRRFGVDSFHDTAGFIPKRFEKR